MTEGLQQIGTALAGPFGALLGGLLVAGAVGRGDLRLKREVVALEAELARSRLEEQRWEGIAMQLLTTTDRSIHVAQSAVQVAHVNSERRP